MFLRHLLLSLWSFCTIPSAWWLQSRQTSYILSQHSEGMSHKRKSKTEALSFLRISHRSHIHCFYYLVLARALTRPSRFKGKGNWLQFWRGDLEKALNEHIWTGQFATLQFIIFIWIPISGSPSREPIKILEKKWIGLYAPNILIEYAFILGSA